MKYLVIGNGAREHALAYKLSFSNEVEKVYNWPASDGIILENKCSGVEAENEDKLLEFALKENIDRVIIGPEQYLVNGLVDKFNEKNIICFGPEKKSAILEGSKIFAKRLMKKYKVKTADFYEVFSYRQAIEYLKEKGEYPVVIKADGLAAGKGVIVAENFEQAEDFCKSLFIENIFSTAGNKAVIERYLKGFEASIIVLCDGKIFLPLLTAKDHKQVFDGNKGPNTGGMGAVAPNPFLDKDNYIKFIEDIMNPTFNAMKNENLLYKGALFFGIMVTENGPYLLEYNVRFGDPETQAILFALENDFNEVIEATISGNLDKINLKWKDGYTLALVYASSGYPLKFKKGFMINGISNLMELKNIELENQIKIFFSAVKNINGNLFTDGGRVLTIVGNGKNIDEARNKVYSMTDKINFENMHFRKDIGLIK
ncbi:MAG: phosphoribosylamine--glycine ligase [Exilispira sp.]